MAKKKKIGVSTASESHTASAEVPVNDAQSAELNPSMQTSPHVVVTIPAPDSAKEEPQNPPKESNDDINIVIIPSPPSVTHQPKKLEIPALIVTDSNAEPTSADAKTAEPTESAEPTEAAQPAQPAGSTEPAETAQTAEPTEPTETAAESEAVPAAMEPAAAESNTEAEPANDDSAPTDEEKAQMRQDNADLSMIDETKDNPYHNVFVDSLDRVTADDLGKPPKKKKIDPVNVIIELFRKAIFWAAVVAFFVSGYQIVTKLYSYRQAEEIYNLGDFFQIDERREDLVAAASRSNRLNAIAPINATQEESDALKNEELNEEFNEKLLMAQGKLQLLRNENKEVVGWIEMPGDTEINYPVVQGVDNDYYLHYAYNGAYNPAGSIYLDYRNKVTVSSNRHTIIYGHNMESGSPMFANLLHFQDESYWKNNRYINIYTDEALYTYEVFAAYQTSPQQAGVENHSWRMNFYKDDNVFLRWVDSVRSRSDISPKVTVDADARILTLSTCMNINENRYVVHAVLVEVIK